MKHIRCLGGWAGWICWDVSTNGRISNEGINMETLNESRVLQKCRLICISSQLGLKPRLSMGSSTVRGGWIFREGDCADIWADTLILWYSTGHHAVRLDSPGKEQSAESPLPKNVKCLITECNPSLSSSTAVLVSTLKILPTFKTFQHFSVKIYAFSKYAKCSPTLQQWYQMWAGCLLLTPLCTHQN